MTKVTGFSLVDENGNRVLADAWVNNVAFKCKMCGHPMLAVILPEQNQHGSTPENPAECRHCHYQCWVVAVSAKKLLRVKSSD